LNGSPPDRLISSIITLPAPFSLPMAYCPIAPMAGDKAARMAGLRGSPAVRCGELGQLNRHIAYNAPAWLTQHRCRPEPVINGT
jgi:hypothetical protein